MPGELQDTILLEAQEDIVRARQAGRELARAKGLGTADQTRLATVISELARNVLLYAGTGACEIFSHRDDGTLTISVVVTDTGPGISDITRAMTPGFSTGNGLGAGLPGVKRLMDTFTIDSRPCGTRIEVSMRRRLP